MSALESLQTEYDALCAKRDAVNAIVAPMQKQLDDENAQVEAARVRAAALAAKISEARGGEQWLGLKRQIGALATAIMALKRAR